MSLNFQTLQSYIQNFTLCEKQSGATYRPIQASFFGYMTRSLSEEQLRICLGGWSAELAVNVF